MISTTSFSWRTGLLVFLAVLALAVPQAALVPIIDRDEPHSPRPSREMLQTGNHVVPTFNGAPRYNKPPLIYWCQSWSFRIFGENILAARLPSLLATAATAFLLFAWGVEFGGRIAGFNAAFAYAFCFQTIQQGRVATADGLLIFFMTLTVWAGWKIITAARPGAAITSGISSSPSVLPAVFWPRVPRRFCPLSRFSFAREVSGPVYGSRGPFVFSPASASSFAGPSRPIN